MLLKIFFGSMLIMEVKMKRFLNLIIGSSLVFIVVGCGVSTPDIVKVEKPTDSQPQITVPKQERL